MKRLFFFTISALTLHLSRCDDAPFSDLAHSFALLNQDGLSPILAGNESEYLEEFGLSGALVKRQRQCQTSGYGNPLLVPPSIGDD